MRTRLRVETLRRQNQLTRLRDLQDALEAHACVPPPRRLLKDLLAREHADDACGEGPRERYELRIHSNDALVRWPEHPAT